MGRWRWAAVCLAMALLAGCGSASVGALTPRGGQLAQALRAWSAFPVGASPRPLVLVGPLVSDPRGAFPDGSTKLAYVEGAVIAPRSFPSRPTTAAGYGLITARQAFGMFESVAGKGPPAPVRLHISAVRLGVGEFRTDRGLRRLPAWRFWFREIRNPAAVLAVGPASIFSPARFPGVRPAVADYARLGPGGRTLSVYFVGEGAGQGPCTAGYSLTVAESSTAVAVAVHEHAHDSTAICPLVGYPRHVTTSLSVPLGARVVVDAYSRTAVPVSGPAG
ncbi:MAG TPA: hypothetical protein VIV12_31045 [Streptosporangiaceae bacterium]